MRSPSDFPLRIVLSNFFLPPFDWPFGHFHIGAGLLCSRSRKFFLVGLHREDPLLMLGVFLVSFFSVVRRKLSTSAHPCVLGVSGDSVVARPWFNAHEASSFSDKCFPLWGVFIFPW